MATRDLKSKGKTDKNIDSKNKVVPIDPSKSATNIDEVSSPVPKQELCSRDEKGRFLKGFSGNPHAWATRKLNTQLALLCRDNVESNIDTLQSIINNEKVDPAVRVAAIKLSFEYGYGKPLQGLDVYNSEHKDYQGFIKYLAREVYEEFNTYDAVNDADKIKSFVSEISKNGSFSNKIYDDLLKYMGSDRYFEKYIEKLKESGKYYKFQETEQY